MGRNTMFASIACEAIGLFRVSRGQAAPSTDAKPSGTHRSSYLLVVVLGFNGDVDAVSNLRWRV